MKKFAAKALASAVGVVCAGLAHAGGSITSPVSATSYAQEAILNTTTITLPTVTYTMGVGRPVGNGFTVIVTPSTGASFSGTCPTLTYGVGTATPGITLKRQSTAECAYDVQINSGNAVAVGDTFTFGAVTAPLHTLGTAGNNLQVRFTLKDPGETACVDNSADANGACMVSKTVAASVQAVNVFAAVSDIGTTADVNASTGPLTGFVAQNDDTATTAKAQLTFDNNSVGAKCPDGATTFSFKGSTTTCVATNAGGTGTAVLTLTGLNAGAATNKFCLDLNNNATLCESGEIFTLSNSTTSVLAIPATSFPDQGATATRNVTFQADGVTSLGTSRTFAVTGTVTPAVGSQHAFADTNSKNANFWVWGANASQLMTSYFNTNPSNQTRFFLLNTGTTAVNYTATCYGESGVAVTYGVNKSGPLFASATTKIDAGTICTFGSNTVRGGVIFTINAPINTVKGTYQTIDTTTGTGAQLLPLVRPYNQANTTE